MTNFKLQVLAVTSVFAAVAIGLVFGSLAHDNRASAANQDEVSVLARQNQALQAALDQLNRDNLTEQTFTEGLAPTILYGRLQGAKVLALSTPSGASSTEGVVRMLSSAGAVVTGSIQLTPKFTDPRYDDELLDLANTALPSSVVTIPNGVGGVAASARLLSAALLTRTPALSATDLRTVLDTYADSGYLRGTGTVTTAADVVVVISGPPDSEEDAVRRNAAALDLVKSFANAGKVVVAGRTDADAGNLVNLARLDPDVRSKASTVDNADTAIGRLLVAWAVADQLAAHPTHYGTGPGATLVPFVAS